MTLFKTGVPLFTLFPFLFYMLFGGLAEANTIQNGSFENGINPPTGGYRNLESINTDVSGWTVSEGNIDWIYGYYEPAEGSRCIDLVGTIAGTIEQSFPTIIGQRYFVIFNMAGNPVTYEGVSNLEVSAAGESKIFSFDNSSASTTYMKWETYAWSFIANDTQTTLSFRSLGDYNRSGPSLDNVIVEPLIETLTDIDDQVFGENSLTRDNIHNVEYLDVTQTIGKSYNQLLNLTQSGGEFEGFQIATISMVHDLLESAGINLEANIMSEPYYAKMKILMHLLGVTRHLYYETTDYLVDKTDMITKPLNSSYSCSSIHLLAYNMPQPSTAMWAPDYNGNADTSSVFSGGLLYRPVNEMAFECATQTQISVNECEALNAFYTSTNGDGWSNNTGWNGSEPCSAYGLTCEAGHISLIDLRNNQLTGTLPAELGNLSSLAGLYLNGNSLTGTIPPELGNLTSLQGLHLYDNLVTGSIPTELGNLSSLSSLLLADNDLTGTISLPVASRFSVASECDLRNNASSLCVPNTNDYQDLNKDPLCGLPLSDYCEPLDAPNATATTYQFTPFYRGYSTNDTDHFYTTSPTERDSLPIKNYTYEKVEGFVAQYNYSGTVPLYRFYSSSGTSHYYTTNDSDAVFTNPNYEHEGIACYVYPVPKENLVPMYHLYSSGDDDHFYTISEFERDNAVSTYGYEDMGVAFYVARNTSGSPLSGKPVAFAGGVDLATGNFIPYRNHVDLANSKGVGLPFVFARTYNSMNLSEAGPLGPGWDHSYNIRIEVADGIANVKWGDGSVHRYIYDGSQYVSVTNGVYNTLEKTLGSYKITTKDGTIYTFQEFLKEYDPADPTDDQSYGKLVYIQNRNGVGLNLQNDPILGNSEEGGVLSHIDDGAGRRYTFDYEPFGSLTASNRYRLTSIVESNAESLTRTISFDYDSQGKLVGYTDAKGNITTYAYENGEYPELLTKITLPEGNTITADYIGDKVAQVQVGSSKIITVDYDYPIATNMYGTRYIEHSGTGNDLIFEAFHDFSQDNKLRYLEDGGGNVTRVDDYDGLNPQLVIDPNNLEYLYEFHPDNGNITKVTNPYAQSTSYSYDNANPNNLLSITNPELDEISLEYDANDNVSLIREFVGGAYRDTIIDRYSNGLIEKVTSPISNSTGYKPAYTYTYDSYGYLSTLTDSLGNVSSYTYDPGGRLENVEDPDGVTLTHTYDMLDQKLATVDMLGRSTTFTYDGNGNLTAINDPRSIITEITYTDQDLVDSVTTAGIRVEKYNYDNAGRKISTVNAEGAAWDIGYDLAGNVASTSTPLGYTDLFDQYTPDGRLKHQTDRRGIGTTYSYDNAGRLISKSIASGYIYGYSYHADNMLQEIRKFTGTTNSTIGLFDYDERNALTMYTDPYGQVVTYTYYPNGNLKEIVYPGNKVVNYDYDARNLLTSVKDWQNRETSYSYTDGGRLLKITYPNGAYVDYTYDSALRLVTISNKQPNGTVIAAYTVNAFDELDAPLDITTAGGISAPVTASLESYGTDSNNRTTSAGNVTFTYNNQGERLTRTKDGEITTYTWNAKDSAGFLQSINEGTNLTTYEYDGLGNRVAKTANGTTTRYVLDVSRKLANVLMETDAADVSKAYYIHGLGLAARILPDDSAQYYHFDRRGNVVALSDDNGNVTDQYSYDRDPFGYGIARQGTTDNPFTFVGRYGVMDEGDNLFYMRARYYDASMGKFLNEDPIGFAGGDLNLYAYVSGNPNVGVDPSGLSENLSVTLNEEGMLVHNQNILGYSNPTRLELQLIELQMESDRINRRLHRLDTQYKVAKGIEQVSRFIVGWTPLGSFANAGTDAIGSLFAAYKNDKQLTEQYGISALWGLVGGSAGYAAKDAGWVIKYSTKGFFEGSSMFSEYILSH